MSENPTIFQVFADVKREVGPVGKDGYNKQGGYNFRGVDAVVNAVASHLDQYGVIIVPHVDKVTYGTVEVGQKRTPMAHALLEVTYAFYGPGGDSFPAKVAAEAMDSGDKAVSKAMSVAWRTALIQALNLPTCDPEPDEQAFERSPVYPAELRPDDPWRAKVGAVGSLKSADVLLNELRDLVASGQIDRQYASFVRDLLDARVNLLRKHEAGTDPGTRQEAAAPQQPEGPAADSPAAVWTGSFRKMLADAAKPEDLDGKRGDLGRAVVERVITSDVATSLSAELGARRAQLEQQAMAAV